MDLVDRTKSILLRPKQEWQVIDGEETSVGGLFIGYIVPLAALGPVASLIGMALVGVFVLALIIDELAPYFRVEENRYQALKVAAYSSTPVWVAGIVGLFPMLNILRLVGLLYSLFLLYLGLPVLMRVPQEKAMRYSVVVMISAVVLFFVVGFIVALLGGGPVIETAGPFPSA